jgi:hypothetical protein
MNLLALPPFIPASITGTPLEFEWKGAREHIGPTETLTPLLKQLGSTTTCGQISMCAGILLWGAWRLKGATPIERYVELAEATFAYQVDWRYLNLEAEPLIPAPDQPPAVSAMTELNNFLVAAVRDYWISYYIPVAETFHSSHVVKHILPKKAAKDFQTWLLGLAERVREIAAKPDEPFKKKKEFPTEEAWKAFLAPHRGKPLPPDILDPAATVTKENRHDLVATFLAGLDWNNNRFLRPPEEMKASGFVGTPYRLDA